MNLLLTLAQVTPVVLTETPKDDNTILWIGIILGALGLIATIIAYTMWVERVFNYKIFDWVNIGLVSVPLSLLCFFGYACGKELETRAVTHTHIVWYCSPAMWILITIGILLLWLFIRDMVNTRWYLGIPTFVLQIVTIPFTILLLIIAVGLALVGITMVLNSLTPVHNHFDAKGTKYYT